MRIENDFFPKKLQSPLAGKKQKNIPEPPNKNITQMGDVTNALSEMEREFLGEVERYIRIDNSGEYFEPKIRVNFAKLKDFLKNAEKHIVFGLGLNSFPNSTAGYGGYHILDKVRRNVFNRMAYICTNEFVQLRQAGKEKEHEEIKKTKMKILDLFVDLVEEYLEKKEQGKLFLHTKYLSTPPDEAFKPLLLNTIKSFRFVIDDYPDYVRNNLDTERASRVFLKLIENRELDNSFDFRIIITLTDLIGAEETRNKINDLLHKERSKKENANQSIIDNLEYARAFITPNHEKIAVESLPDLYENKIKFESYGLNKRLQKKEVALLKELIPPNQKVLEVGMGTGRLFLEMEKAGYDITGYDFTNRHVALVKGASNSAKVFKGDWKNNALKEESFDVVYSLGRNVLHEYSLPDQVQMFREANRVLKKGGRFIFDIPDRNKGEYAERVKEYADLMRNEFHINNFRYGAIYDSPNGIDFTTRYAYAEEDIKNLAQLTGFKIVEVRREELPTGKGDENLYYVLEKI